MVNFGCPGDHFAQFRAASFKRLAIERILPRSTWARDSFFRASSLIITTSATQCCVRLPASTILVEASYYLKTGYPQELYIHHYLPIVFRQSSKVKEDILPRAVIGNICIFACSFSEQCPSASDVSLCRRCKSYILICSVGPFSSP